MPGRLADKVAIVTGAGRGVGRGTAILMAREGAKVVAADNGSSVDGSGRSGEPAERVVEEIEADGGVALAMACDVSSRDEARQIVDAAIETWGKLDILVNVAGNFRVNTIADVTTEDWDSLRAVHMDGMMHTSHFACLHWKQRAEYGRLINFTSDSCMSGVPDTFAYAAAKGAVVGMTRSIANAMVSYNVTANCMTQVSLSRMADSYYPDAEVKPSEAAPPDQRPRHGSTAGALPRVTRRRAHQRAHIRFLRLPLHSLERTAPRSVSRKPGRRALGSGSPVRAFRADPGRGLSLESDLQWPMASLDQAAGSAEIDDLLK